MYDAELAVLWIESRIESSVVGTSVAGLSTESLTESMTVMGAIALSTELSTESLSTESLSESMTVIGVIAGRSLESDAATDRIVKSPESET
jgi:hypothetical protein